MFVPLVYMTQISTIVDQAVSLGEVRVYMTQQIYTIVDSNISPTLTRLVYMTQQISTIVD